MKAHSEKSMNVSDVKETDEDGLLSRSMMIKANNTIMKERIWINSCGQQDCVSAWHPDNGAP